MTETCDLLICPTPAASAASKQWPSDTDLYKFSLTDESDLTTLPMTKSLSGFLHQFCTVFVRRGLRMMGPSGNGFIMQGEMKSIPLWVDAICINQDDPAEKGRQILLMGEIYAKATQVIVWLGYAGPDMETFVWMHRKMFRTMLDVMREAGFPNNINKQLLHLARHDPMDPDFWEARGLFPQRPGDSWASYWEAYLSFYSGRQWFRWSWVVQEVCPAARLVPLCGDWLLDWRDLEYFAQVLERSG